MWMASPAHILLILLGTQFLLSMTPGQNWVLIIQNSIESRNLGLATAAGVPCAVIGLALLSMAGGSIIFETLPQLFLILKIICGAYLIYIGLRAIGASMRKSRLTGEKTVSPSLKAGFLMGFISSLSNPKGIPYFASIFAATGAYGMPLNYKVAALLLMPAISLACNSSVALMASHPFIKKKLLVFGSWSQRLIGCVMIGLGIYMFIGSP
jgi:threonine/homoserine/homoserine lactone efflux protein